MKTSVSYLLSNKSINKKYIKSISMQIIYSEVYTFDKQTHINAKQKTKKKDCELCLGNVSKGFPINNMKKQD